MGSLTILDDLRVATPCRANWDEMVGDDRVRFCSDCSRSVYNIGAMTSTEAVALIAGREGRLCARLFRRADGTVVTADCPPVAVQAPVPDRFRPRFGRVHALVLILAALLLARLSAGESRTPPSQPGVTWDDWVEWAGVTLGLKPAPKPAPPLAPTLVMGDCY
jgi:hypothetical protein